MEHIEEHNECCKRRIGDRSDEGVVYNSAENKDILSKNKALREACKNGHAERVEMLIEYGANDFNGGLNYACRKGHLRIAFFVMYKGGDKINAYAGLFGAARGGQMTIFKVMETMIMEQSGIVVGLNHILFGACESGNMTLVKYLVSKGARDFDGGLESACAKGKTNIAEYMIQMGAQTKDIGFKIACMGGHMETIYYLINQGVKSWPNGLLAGCLGLRNMVVELMLEKMGDAIDTKLLNECLKISVSGGAGDIVDMLIKKGANDFNEGLRRACIFGYKAIISLMIDNGAWECRHCGRSMELHKKNEK